MATTKTVSVWTKDETSKQIEQSLKEYDVPMSQVTNLNSTISNLQSQIDGQSKAFVLETGTDLKNWMLESPTTTGAKVGDDVYTIPDDVYDFWIANVSNTAEYHIAIDDSGTEYESYYNLVKSTADKVDLSQYVKNLSGTATNGVLTGLSKSGNTLTVTSTNLTQSGSVIDGQYVSAIDQAANGKIKVYKGTLPTNSNQKIQVNSTGFSDDATINIVTSGKLTGVVSGNTATLGVDLSGKQDTLTTTQLAAVNSGVTSATVSQVNTNKTNISTLQTGLNTANTNITSLTTRVTSLENTKPTFKQTDGLTTGGILTITYTE